MQNAGLTSQPLPPLCLLHQHCCLGHLELQLWSSQIPGTSDGSGPLSFLLPWLKISKCNSGSEMFKAHVFCGRLQVHPDSPPMEKRGLSWNLGRFCDHSDPQNTGKGCSARPMPEENGSFSFLKFGILAPAKKVLCKKSDYPKATKLWGCLRQLSGEAAWCQPAPGSDMSTEKPWWLQPQPPSAYSSIRGPKQEKLSWPHQLQEPWRALINCRFNTLTLGVVSFSVIYNHIFFLPISAAWESFQCVSVCVCRCVCVYTCESLCVHLQICVCMSVHVYLCLCVYPASSWGCCLHLSESQNGNSECPAQPAAETQWIWRMERHKSLLF